MRPNPARLPPPPACRDLEVKSEKELDELLAKLNFRLQHESIPLSEEKRILGQLKKLEGARERVRECEASGGALEDGRQRRKELMDQWGEHNAEIRLLADEKNTAHAILEKFREQVRALPCQDGHMLVRDVLSCEAMVRQCSGKNVQGRCRRSGA